MTEAFATCAGAQLERVTIHVPAIGPWFADADFTEAPDVSGRVELRAGGVVFSGTVDPGHTGTFGLQRRLRVVGGAGGWATLVRAQGYHSDAQVRARLVVEDAAREAGETLGATFAPAAEQIGIDYVRQAGPASRVLEDAIGPVAWWVDYDGLTHVGARPDVEADVERYQVLEHDPREGLVVLAVDHLGAVGIGSVLTEALDAPQTVRELEIVVDADVVVRAWCGPAGAPTRLARAFRALVRRETDAKLFGSWRYRLVRMTGDRVDLQAVAASAELPDILSVSMSPGVAGAHAELTPGTVVLVEFVEGDRKLPRVTGFAGKDGDAWAPVNLVFDASVLIKLGKDAVALAARADLTDQRLATVQSTFDVHTHSYLLAPGTPTTPTVSAVPNAPIGALASVAADKVKVQ